MLKYDDLVKNVASYNMDGLPAIQKAYQLAEELHYGQFRQSGEPYIIHPLNVAYILSELHADTDTICAGLLHDTLEDSDISKEEIKEMFNEDVANLVDGVTKISKLNFSTKQEQNMANTRKIITGLTQDVRIIIIKLADRLHNMRTLSFKSEFKQKENSIETMEIFVPMAYYLGTYRIKSELEDISLRYLRSDTYKRLEEEKRKIEEEKRDCIIEMLYMINDILDKNDIDNKIKVRTKNIYGIYKKLSQGYDINEIHDLISFKIMVEEIKDCYLTLGLIHSIYHPINEKFKDYICNPKTNLYRSIHSTVFGPNDTLVQTQMRTFDMDKIASFGITASWDIAGDKFVRKNMQDELKKYQFYKSLKEVDKMFSDNEEFVNQVKQEVFSNKVYVYSPKGEVIELPKGSTPLDFVYRVNSELADRYLNSEVNDHLVDINYVLQNKDRIKINVADYSIGPNEEWLDIVKTTRAKRKIKDDLNKRKR